MVVHMDKYHYYYPVQLCLKHASELVQVTTEDKIQTQYLAQELPINTSQQMRSDRAANFTRQVGAPQSP